MDQISEAQPGRDLDPDRVTLPKHFRDHGYWTGRVSKIYHMGIPVDILQGTSGTDHVASWDVAHNIMAMESMTPGKIVDYLNPDDPAAFSEERTRWQKAHDSGSPWNSPERVETRSAVFVFG